MNVDYGFLNNVDSICNRSQRRRPQDIAEAQPRPTGILWVGSKTGKQSFVIVLGTFDFIVILQFRTNSGRLVLRNLSSITSKGFHFY